MLATFYWTPADLQKAQDPGEQQGNGLTEKQGACYISDSAYSFQMLHSSFVRTRRQPMVGSHIHKQHPRSLPTPVVPHFPQQVMRADGSKFTYWTIYPRPHIILTQNTTNHILWNATERLCGGSAVRTQDEEDEGTGRMCRRRKRFSGDVATEQWSVLQEGFQSATEPLASKGPATAKTPSKN
ncbi:hypothetical protein F5J12DRAFT_439911 [Pisolithus orientalis]|uniref:uncharacterized protein n=1 Tax=Pisolithus orientalis TaxID=936130 RepID=UPI0022245EB7|nr:uncharacterized protein F5J12DRAFT_439911 [Pisolithus orientalis]KAI6025588.1 hypothetical protein F5J12DRAFT_439911 [Pisolithus orientalis]